MKKIKNILLMSIVAVCSFAFVNVVNAADIFTMPTMDLVCNPNAIEAGGRTTCYIVGQPSKQTGSLHGFVTQAYTTSKYTKIELVNSNKSIANTGAVFTKDVESTSKPFASGDVPASIKEFNCAFDSSINAKKGEGDFLCAAIFSKGTENLFTPVTIKNGVDGILSAEKKSDGYGIIGSVVVSLTDDAVVNECGELCVKVWNIPSEKLYSNYKECAGTKANSAECENTATSVNANDYFCKEIHLKGKPVQPSPPTGAFASYAILAAGALIAISAVAMAKKNNKFNRI